MTTFTISSRISGITFGEYDGATADAAIESMHRDAGYRSTAAAAEALSTTVDALRAELRVEECDVVASVVERVRRDDISASDVLAALCPGGVAIEGVEAEQDWHAGVTTLSLRDGTRIVVDDQDVSVIDASDDTDGSYRAAYWLSADGQSEVVLTGREHASLDDDALEAEALAEARRAGLELEGGRIVIGTWRESV